MGQASRRLARQHSDLAPPLSFYRRDQWIGGKPKEGVDPNDWQNPALNPANREPRCRPRHLAMNEPDKWRGG